MLSGRSVLVVEALDAAILCMCVPRGSDEETVQQLMSEVLIVQGQDTVNVRSSNLCRLREGQRKGKEGRSAEDVNEEASEQTFHQGSDPHPNLYIKHAYPSHAHNSFTNPRCPRGLVPAAWPCQTCDPPTRWHAGAVLHSLPLSQASAVWPIGSGDRWGRIVKRRMTGGALSEAARALRSSPVSRNVFDRAKHATEFAVRSGVSIVCFPLTLITAG
jgi:hypothetical protein